MKTEEFEKLASFENNFKLAIESDYVRNISRPDRDILFDYYNTIPGVKWENPHCLNCLVLVCKIVGSQWFEFKDRKGAIHANTKTEKERIAPEED